MLTGSVKGLDLTSRLIRTHTGLGSYRRQNKTCPFKGKEISISPISFVSDIKDFVNSSGGEYDIRMEESSSSEKESDDEVPLANKEKDNDENESEDDDVPLAVLKSECE